MQEEPNPVKDFLFEYISKSEQKIQKLVSEQKFSDIINDIMMNCYDKAIAIEEKHKALGILATGILHYLLTNALITSQRKIECQGIELDIVIPDVKTLEKDSQKTLIICIPKTNNRDQIIQKIHQLKKIQSETQNIWLVLSEKQDVKNKTYIIGKDENSFADIIFDIAKFVNVQGQNKFKILRV
ncbi:hypothetical protein NsoK4_03955 [Nitrosopumilus sp. K4]|nr:hypothetical protein [Nitrosopumilus sp. K4]QUC65666.1 hypothetical protein NsoK4_03955 [Nitrosopumilus sp. K4]